MSLLKNSSYLLTDTFGNIYHILYKDNNIEFIRYDKILSNSKQNTIAKNCNEHFFATIDKNNKIYMIYQKLDNNEIYFNTYSNGIWNSLILPSEEKYKIYEPYIIKDYNNFHVFYVKNSGSNDYDFIHTSIYNKDLIKNKLFTIKTKGILNSYNVIPYNKGIIILYIDLKNHYNNIVMRYFDLENNKLEKEIILNKEKNEKYYLDSLLLNNKTLSMTYSVKQEENFKIVFDYVNLNNKHAQVESRAILSNLSNAIYPTIINNNGDIWTCWYEYQNIMSSVKRKNKDNFEGPYLWRKVKGENILRYAYYSNIKNNSYKFNYAFGTFPDISFIGFGDISDAEKIPLKKKLKDDDDMEYVKPEKYYKEYEDDELDKFKSEIKENKKLITKILQSNIKENDTYEQLNERFEKIENNYKELENRINEIEEFLTRRRRGS
ncbi:MAG: hypothetical protein ACTHVE_06290, partial [Senegalia sp. (in: firmicutes)]